MVDERDDPHRLAAKILGEIQAEGLRAAGALVDRLVHLVDGPRAAPADDPDVDSPIDMGAVLPWLDLWRDLIERTSDTVERIRSAASLTPTHPVTVTVVGGGRGEGEMWLHNGTDDDFGELVPQCGPLSDGYGNLLDCDVDINPPKIDQLHSGSSRGLLVSITAGPSAAPGLYRGVVQVRGAESVWMAIEVRMDAPSP